MTESSQRPPAVNHIRAERPEDSLAIEEVVRQAFGQEDEASLVRALRDGGFNLLSLVALKCEQIVGHLLFTRLTIEGEDCAWDAVALAPLAVSPAFQKTGVGAALMHEGLNQLKDRGETIVVVLGHEHYYTRFGFSAELAKPLLAPFSGPSWMAIELQPGALTGVSGSAKYAPPFGIH
jgi:putative acetyltransferase